MDQTASMRGIVARNAGEMILEMQLTEDTVHDAVWRLMSSPMYHQAARALSQIINHFDTAQAFNAVMDQIFAGLPSTYAPR
jgi:UDP:flavonoid glycosyltransferase YjiC (YdhE family)